LNVDDPLDVIPLAWRSRLTEAANNPDFAQTLETVKRLRSTTDVYPPADQMFAALELTSPESVRVVILGQDPYPRAGQANGLAFSVAPGIAIPRSLQNILKSLSPELTYEPPTNGSLVPWARQGVLLLNTVLTVEAGNAGSHEGLNWQSFTDDVIRAVSDSPEIVVFLLWGKRAQTKAGLIDRTRHEILMTSHPSPLSVRRGFFRDRPLLAANEALRRMGRSEIDWRLP
jgi:uracil-DNA glycosylase